MKRPPLGPWRALVATPADTALTALLAIGLGWAGWGGAAMIVTALVFSQSQPAPRVVIKAQ